MQKKLFLLIFLLFTVILSSNAFDNNVYEQTLNMGSEEYFFEDTTVYPGSEDELVNPSVQYVENNYNYLPQTPYNYSTFQSPYFGGYTVTVPGFLPNYRPHVPHNKPMHDNFIQPPPPPVQNPPLPPNRRPKPPAQRPFTFNYGHSAH